MFWRSTHFAGRMGSGWIDAHRFMDRDLRMKIKILSPPKIQNPDDSPTDVSPTDLSPSRFFSKGRPSRGARLLNAHNSTRPSRSTRQVTLERCRKIRFRVFCIGILFLVSECNFFSWVEDDFEEFRVILIRVTPCNASQIVYRPAGFLSKIGRFSHHFSHFFDRLVYSHVHSHSGPPPSGLSVLSFGWPHKKN